MTGCLILLTSDTDWIEPYEQQQANWWPLGFRDWLFNAVGIFWGDKDILELDSSGASTVNWLHGA